MRIRVEVFPFNIHRFNPATLNLIGDVDEFVRRFIRDDMLTVGKPSNLPYALEDAVHDYYGIRLPICNLVKHSGQVVTFDVAPVACDKFALNMDSSPEDIGSVDNVLLAVIADDADPLANPRGSLP